MKNYFFITGLPRTRSTWLANFLTYNSGFCFHEAIRLCYKIEDMKPLLDSVSASNSGDADAMLVFYIDKIIEIFPDAKWVVIKRSLEEVMDSLRKRYNFRNPEADRKLFERAEEKINNFIDEHPTLVIDFNSLNERSTCEKLWNYCITDSEFDYARWMQLDVVKLDPMESKMLEYHGETPKRTVKDYVGTIR